MESSHYLLFTLQVVAMTSLHHQSSALFVPTIKVLNLKAIFKSLWLVHPVLDAFGVVAQT